MINSFFSNIFHQVFSEMKYVSYFRLVTHQNIKKIARISHGSQNKCTLRHARIYNAIMKRHSFQNEGPNL